MKADVQCLNEKRALRINASDPAAAEAVASYKMPVDIGRGVGALKSGIGIAPVVTAFRIISTHPGHSIARIAEGMELTPQVVRHTSYCYHLYW